MLTKTDRPKKALPLKLWLALEDDVQRHKAEIAAQFAQARARLLPVAHPLPMCLRFENDFATYKVTLNDDGTPNIVVEYQPGRQPAVGVSRAKGVKV